jgi:hypothetical protein
MIALGLGNKIMRRWQFKTRNFIVMLDIERKRNYRYDGDDDGETQAGLDSGEIVAFDATVYVILRNEDDPIAASHMSGHVYKADDVPAFWTDHRGPDPMNRNCSLQRPGVSICHYFPDMVRDAIWDARKELAARLEAIPYVRGVSRGPVEAGQ